MTITLAAFLVLAAPAPPDEAPKGAPPQVVTISVQDDGKPVVTLLHMRQVPEERVRKVQMGKEFVEQKYTVLVPVYESVTLALDGKEVQVYGVDGKKIEPKDVRNLIHGTTPAFLSADGKPVDPFYLRLAKSGTLVLVGPAQDNAPPILPPTVPIPFPNLPDKKIPDQPAKP